MVHTTIRVITEKRDYQELYRQERRSRRMLQDLCLWLVICLIVMALGYVWLVKGM